MLVRSANGTYEAIDFRETAPAAAYENMFESNTKGWLFGGLSRYLERLLLSIRRLTPRKAVFQGKSAA